MRTWLIIALMVLLPLQLTWAATVAYCAHENGQQNSHFGHHAHKHAAADERVASTDKGKLSTPQVDMDCGTCHAGCPAALSKTTVVASLPTDPLLPETNPLSPPSAWDSRPDRPQWEALA